MVMLDKRVHRWIYALSVISFLSHSHRRIQDFLGGAQGQVHPDVYWLHSSEDPTAQVTFFNKYG